MDSSDPGCVSFQCSVELAGPKAACPPWVMHSDAILERLRAWQGSCCGIDVTLVTALLPPGLLLSLGQQWAHCPWTCHLASYSVFPSVLLWDARGSTICLCIFWVVLPDCNGPKGRRQSVDHSSLLGYNPLRWLPWCIVADFNYVVWMKMRREQFALGPCIPGMLRHSLTNIP